MKDIFIIILFWRKKGVERLSVFNEYTELAEIIKDVYGYNYDSSMIEICNTYTWSEYAQAYVWDTAYIESMIEELSQTYEVHLVINKNEKSMYKQTFGLDSPGTYYNAMSERLMEPSKEDYGIPYSEFMEPRPKAKFYDRGHQTAEEFADNFRELCRVFRYGYDVGFYEIKPYVAYHICNEGSYKNLPKQEWRQYSALGCGEAVADIAFEADAFGIFVDYDVVYKDGHPSRFRDTDTGVKYWESEMDQYEAAEYTTYSTEQERSMSMMDDFYPEDEDYSSDRMEYNPLCEIPIAYHDYYGTEMSRNDWYEYRASMEQIIEEDWEKFEVYCKAWNEYLDELKEWEQEQLRIKKIGKETRIAKRCANKPPIFKFNPED